jgi:hypothetical protein
MIPDGFSGGMVIKANDDEEEIKKYKEMIDAMSIEEFVDFIEVNKLSKSYTPVHIVIRKLYIDKYYLEWARSTYVDFITDSINNYRDMDSNITSAIYEKIKNVKKTVGSYIRLESIIMMIHGIQPLEKSDYTCTVFSITKTGSDIQTNYAYLYSIIVPKVRDIISDKSVVHHKYFCTGPNLMSTDGEYRNRFTNIYTIEYAKMRHMNIWNEVEEYLTNRPKVVFNQNYYIPSNIKDIHITSFKDNINAHRFAMELFIISWISQGLIFYLNLQNNHIDDTYNKNMFDPEDKRFIAHLIEKYTIDKLKLFYWESGFISGHISSPSANPLVRYNPTMGQKIIPITEEESNNVGDIRYPVWREYYIQTKISDLFINLVCPGVSITHDWFYIHGVNKHLFNNPDMFNRILISDEAREIVHKLKKARRAVYYGMDLKSDKLTQLSKVSVLKEEELIVSDKSIIVISEYVGRTVNDILYSMKSEEYKSSVGSIFSNPDEFFKYLFDVTYALLCMNSKLNIIHGDLHLNNTTIQHTFKSYIHKNVDVKNTHTLYLLNNEIFMFKNTGKVGAVIDFSRGFIITEGEDYFLLKEQQSERIMGYYSNLFPEFVKSFGNKLKIKLAVDFEHVYKIFSAIDMYIHTERLIKFTETNDILQTHKKVKELIIKVNNISRHYLEVVMEKILTKNMDIDSTKYPNYDIILRCFGDYIISPQKLNDPKLGIDDIFFYNNKLRYSINSYDKLPPREKYMRLKKQGESKSMDIPVITEQMKRLFHYYNIKDH